MRAAFFAAFAARSFSLSVNGRFDISLPRSEASEKDNEGTVKSGQPPTVSGKILDAFSDVHLGIYHQSPRDIQCEQEGG